MDYSYMVYANGGTTGVDFYIQNASGSTTRNLTKFEVWWAGSQTLRTATIDGNTIWGGAGVTNTSPTYVTLSSAYPFGTWQYSQFQFMFNSVVTADTIIFVKYTFADGCYAIYGSHP
jgi:hypothetical protein